MYVITFTNDIPEGFDKVTVAKGLDLELPEVLQAITQRYISNNFPELLLGEDAYEAKRADQMFYYSPEYILDRHNVNNYTFTIEEADSLWGE